MTDALTPEKIEELRGLLAKATPGPWAKAYTGDFIVPEAHLNRPIGFSTDDAEDLAKYAQTIAMVKQDRHGRGRRADNLALIVAMRNALPALLASLASKDAEIEELRVRLDRSRDEYHRKIDHDLMRARAERDEWKEACRRAGVCMSCATSNRDPMGCTDCMNTGWDGGSPMEARMAEDRADSAESRLTTALAALGEAKSGLVEIEAITPHKATRLCARAALAKLNALEGNEDGTR